MRMQVMLGNSMFRAADDVAALLSHTLILLWARPKNGTCILKYGLVEHR